MVPETVAPAAGADTDTVGAVESGAGVMTESGSDAAETLPAAS